MQKIAETPEESDFTSAQDRIESAKNLKKSRGKSRKQKRTILENLRDRFLSPVFLNERKAPGPMVSKLDSRASDKGFLPMKLQDYLELLDWTGRQLSRGKRGRIPIRCKPILERIGISREVWCELVENFGKLFNRVAGKPDSIAAKSPEGSPLRSRGGPELLSG